LARELYVLNDAHDEKLSTLLLFVVREIDKLRYIHIYLHKSFFDNVNVLILILLLKRTKKKKKSFRTERGGRAAGNKRRDRDRRIGADPDNAYYAQLTTGQTMQNNILVCHGNNSIITSKWEILTQFALQRQSTLSLSLSPRFAFPLYPTLVAQTHTYTRTLYKRIYVCVCVCVYSLTFVFPAAMSFIGE